MEAVGFFAVVEGFFTVEALFFAGIPFFFTTAADFFLGAAFLLLEDEGFFVVAAAFDVFLVDAFAGFALAGTFFLVAVLAFFPAVSFVAFFGFLEGSALRAPAAAAPFFTTFIVGFGFGFGAGFFASALSLYELLTCTPPARAPNPIRPFGIGGIQQRQEEAKRNIEKGAQGTTRMKKRAQDECVVNDRLILVDYSYCYSAADQHTTTHFHISRSQKSSPRSQSRNPFGTEKNTSSSTLIDICRFKWL